MTMAAPPKHLDVACRLLDAPPGSDAIPGDVWACPWLLDEPDNPALSLDFYRQWGGKRAPLCVVLPGGHHWVVDGVIWKDGKPDPDRKGWTVTGVAPKLTARPSIRTGGVIWRLSAGVLRAE